MRLPSLVTPSGIAIPLERKLAEGGEGAVYTLRNDQTQVAKVYFKPPSKQTVQKLMAMVGLGNPKLLKVAAWPCGLLCEPGTYAVVGFLMPKVSDSQPIQHLYNPVQRLKCFPQAGWNFQVHAAANLAAAFDEVHAAGCLVGDVNQSNALVSSHKDTLAMVRLIDCDSFQVQSGRKQFLCEVGVVHYTPPELQKKSFRDNPRTENHDRFGLAVLIYQLLFAGRHPYMGLHSDEASFEQLIGAFRFSQGPAARTWGMEPPPHTPTFDDIPPELGNLFRKAFERGSDVNARPRPIEWKNALDRLGKEIETCKADADHRYWRGAKSCVWCRLALRGGPEYYFGVSGGTAAFTVDEAKLQEVQRRLAAAHFTEHAWDRERYLPKSRPSPLPLPPDIARLRADWEAALPGFQAKVDERSRAELREVQQAEAREKQQIARIKEEYQERQAELDEEFEAEREAVKEEKAGRAYVTICLIVAVGLGVVMLPMGLAHKAFALIGLLVIITFGIWLSVHIMMSPQATSRRRMARLRRLREQVRAEAEAEIEHAMQETKEAKRAARARTQEINSRNRRSVDALESAYRQRVQAEAAVRRRRYDEAEAAIRHLESTWVDKGRQYRKRHQDTIAAINTAVTECRGLKDLYQSEVSRLTAHAEVAARQRHMRLHLIADAEIQKIGDGRKQTLALHNIYTAADIDEAAIRNIKGFGDMLTRNLLAWRDEVHRQFTFDPLRAVAPAELQPITVRYRAAQQQFHNVANQGLTALDAIGPAYVGELQQLVPQLQEASVRWAQMKADLSILPE
jgi:DNA-binding helix-hairpin-helix protein with protein kinase domain